ncbi:MAG: hypothetical protein ABGY08_10740, partial [Gammaproteobacteria bacterium]
MFLKIFEHRTFKSVMASARLSYAVTWRRNKKGFLCSICVILEVSAKRRCIMEWRERTQDDTYNKVEVEQRLLNELPA